LIAENYCFVSDSTYADCDGLGKRLRDNDSNLFSAKEAPNVDSDHNLEASNSKPLFEEAEVRVNSHDQQSKMKIQHIGKRQKQSRDYLLNDFSVCMPEIPFFLVSQACKLIQKTCSISDKRRKKELISVHESLNTIKLGYVLSDSSKLMQGLDVLSPRGFSILKKIAFHEDKPLKNTVRVLLNKNKNGETAKIQLLTQEIALKLCQDYKGKPLISFIMKSLESFIGDFKHSLKSLTSCDDISKLSEVVTSLLEVVLKNAPAVKAFLNHVYTLILRNKARLEIQNFHTSEVLILNKALESISEACKSYENCFRENPLEFNQTYWNQCDSFSGGGLVLYIQQETFDPNIMTDFMESEDYTCDRMADRPVLATQDSYARYEEGSKLGQSLDFHLQEEL